LFALNGTNSTPYILRARKTNVQLWWNSRTRESERGRKNPRKRSKNRIDRYWKEKLARYSCRKTIHTIVLMGLEPALCFFDLPQGRDGEHRWNESLKVLDDLIWCLHPHPKMPSAPMGSLCAGMNENPAPRGLRKYRFNFVPNSDEMMSQS